VNRPDCNTETLDASDEREAPPAPAGPEAEIAALKAALDESRAQARKARQQGRDEMLLAALQAIGQAPSGPTKAAVTAEIHNGHRALEKL
jgi:hypothetical protein